MRNRYDRLTPDELKKEIRELGLTFGQFARIIGTQRDRVLRWINGREDIPHSANAFCALLALPGAIELALDVADDWITEREPEEETAIPDTS